MSIATQRIRQAIKDADVGGISNACALASILRGYGFHPSMHVGTPPEQFTPQMTAEWYLGQGISIVESEAWFAMNSWFNCVDKFLPETFEFTVQGHLSESLFTID